MTHPTPDRRPRRLWATVLAVVAALFAAGCSKPPQESVDRVRQAMLEARGEQAELYAPDALAAAQAALDQVEAELEMQLKRPAPLRRYERASKLADTALEAAHAAKVDAAAARDDLRLQLEPELPALSDALPAALGLVENAGKVRGIRLDAAGLAAEIEAIGVLVAEARVAFDAGRYADAASMSIEAKERLNGVQRTVQEALDLARKPAARS